MATTLEIKYFNSFVLKKSSTAADGSVPIWNGSFGIPKAIGGYNNTSTVLNEGSWIVEESRIRGGYNNTSTGYGVRAYLVEDEPNSSIRFNSLIYSGIYNSRTGVNNTNVFSIADEITRSLDPVNGSIQKLHAENTNLTIFQEGKVSKALIDKDAIYSAEGGGLPVSSLSLVIGQIVPYLGKYGIGNHPESFAVYGYNKYFVDSYQNVVLRLSRSGIDEISSTGMRSFFRNQIINTDSANFGKGKLIGAWDAYNKEYALSIQPSNPSKKFNTLSYDDRSGGWISNYSYKPNQSFSLKNQHYTTTDSTVYIHNSAIANYNNFYNVQNPSSVTFVFNPQVSNIKVFNTIDYEGSNGWQVDSFISSETGPGTQSSAADSVRDKTNVVFSFLQGSYDSAVPPNTGAAAIIQPIFHAGFDRKENVYCANLVNRTPASQGEIVFGPAISGIKGFFSTVKMSTDTVTNPGGYKELFAVSSNYTFANGY